MAGEGAAGRRAAAHVFVEDLEAPVVDDGDRHHLAHVLRLRPGEYLTVSDGRGGLRRCRLRDGLLLDPLGETTHAPRPAPPLTVAFALVKGDRPEWVVQKLTECGVDRIVAMRTERTVVRWSAERAERALARLRAVAREAAMQSRRLWLPAVDGVVPFSEVAVAPGAVLADSDGAPPDLAHPVVLVGPEGGWSDAERAIGTDRVTLGPAVLRAETAAVAAGVLLAGMRAGIVRPAAPT